MFDEALDGLVAVRGFLGEGLLDDGAKRGVDILQIGLGGEMLHEDLAHAVSLVGDSPRQELVEDDPLIEAQGASLDDGERPKTSVFTIENGQGRFLGHCAVVAIEGSPDGFEIGFQLSRESWGHGLGTRLGEFLCTYAIHCCAAFRIEANCLEGNVGSRTILTRLGLEIEGTRPAYRRKEKARHAELLFGAEVSRLDSARFRRCADELGLG